MKYTNKSILNKMTSARVGAGYNSKYFYRVFQILCAVMEVECVVNLIVCLCVTAREAGSMHNCNYVLVRGQSFPVFTDYNHVRSIPNKLFLKFVKKL
jgi:hypothetical protein